MREYGGVLGAQVLLLTGPILAVNELGSLLFF